MSMIEDVVETGRIIAIASKGNEVETIQILVYIAVIFFICLTSVILTLMKREIKHKEKQEAQEKYAIKKQFDDLHTEKRDVSTKLNSSIELLNKIEIESQGFKGKVKTEMESIKERCQIKYDDVTKLESKVTTLDDSVREIKSKVDTVLPKIKMLDSRVERLEEDNREKIIPSLSTILSVVSSIKKDVSRDD